jgi:carboxyl-terminal processing protease
VARADRGPGDRLTVSAFHPIGRRRSLQWGCLLGLLMLTCASLSWHGAAAEPFSAAPSFDQRLIADVTGTALAFMGPRTLEAIPAGQLSLWGLRGLTAIDPRLVAELSPQQLRLTLSGRVLVSRPPPPAIAAAARTAQNEVDTGWGDAIGQLSRAAWDASEPVRRAGTQGILRAFFDELFNHLDPYSRYATPQEAAEEEARRNGRAGIGVDIVRAGNSFAIRNVLPGSPAARAGIRSGDMLLEVDGIALDGADLSAVTALIRGPEGSMASLTLRTGARGSRVMNLTRMILAPATVFAQRQGDLLYMRVTNFARDTADSMARELTRAMEAPRPAKGLVLDIRGNRGGLLRQAVAAADTLMTEGRIASTAGRDSISVQDYNAGGADLWRGLPVVVVVDGRTASSAEILAAALSDQRRAVVVGSATLGKGLVQTILPLPDGGALSLTWSRVLAPLGWPLQALGVLPQVCTSLGEDPLKRALAELSQGRQPMARALTRHREARAPMPPAEILEIRNACPASEGRDTDLMAAKFLIETPLAYATALIPVLITP